MNIGFFDSGLGGLTVLKKCRQLLPEYNYVYVADNLHLPYGEKNPDQIFQYTTESLEKLIEADCSLIILACNTATAIALRKIQQEWIPQYHPNVKVLGVIRPAVETIVENNPHLVGVMATEAAVHSKGFEDELKKISPDIKVFQQSCPLLVPMIEQNSSGKNEILAILQRYINPLLKNNIDTLLLGCTHYELLVDYIQQIIPQTVRLVTEGTATANKLKIYLNNHPEIETELEKNADLILLATQPSEKYKAQMKAVLDR